MDNLKHEWLPVSKLVANDGRIAGLPSNPRQWNKQEFELLKNSIEETPQLLEARGLIVYPVGDVFVVLGGNMRLAAIKELGHTTAPCIVIPEGTNTDTLKAIVIKDNGSFGQWDYDMLANEWDTETLKEWGVPIWTMGTTGGDLAEGEEVDLSSMVVEPVSARNESETGIHSITFVFDDEDADTVNSWIANNSKLALVKKIVEICRNVEAK